MKTQTKILVAFLLNLAFSVVELIGGFLTNSVAIISDSVHDFGDAVSIGISFFLERKSHRQPDDNYTYGYARFSVLGGLITTIILVIGSILVVGGSIVRIINPVEVNYDGMIILAIFGVILNFAAAYVTRDSDSINQKSVNLHMLEDVLGWVVVLVGAVLMRFTNLSIIDPIMSIGVAIFIFISALKNLHAILDLFLVKKPDQIDVKLLRKQLEKIPDVVDVHHVHIWSMDGNQNYITMHLKSSTQNYEKLKKSVKHILEENHIQHSTIEIETPDEHCDQLNCHVEIEDSHLHHHRH